MQFSCSDISSSPSCYTQPPNWPRWFTLIFEAQSWMNQRTDTTTTILSYLRSKARTKTHVGNVVAVLLLLGLNGCCRKELVQRGALKACVELLLVSRSCVFLRCFVGLLLSRKLCVESTWDGYELFTENSWSSQPAFTSTSSVYKRNIAGMQIHPFALGKQNS